MKKIVLLIIIPFFSVLSFSQNASLSKYSKEIDCEYPETYDVSGYLKSASDRIDLEKYKTVIRNGDISAIEKPYLDDFQLGALSKTELRLFRNLIFAKKGYIFSDKELEKFYKQFDWYKPTTRNVTFTDLEQTAIDRIKRFESESSIKYDYEEKDIVWEEWTHGADQRGFKLKLNKDKSFEFEPSGVINRLKKLSGTWSIENNKIVLLVKSENVLFGGYVATHPNTPYIDKATPVIISYENPIKIIFPLNDSDWNDGWIMIGTGDCYISKW